MRHRIYGKHFGRDKNERKALFKGLVRSLLSYGTIQTSEVKAKAVKGLVDKIINSVKSNSKSGNLVQSFVVDRELRERLIKEIVPKLGSRTSGFTRIVRMGPRLGDQTTMVKISLIEAEQLSVPSSRLSDRGESVVGKSVTDKQKTGKLKFDNRNQKTDNRKVKKASYRSKK